MYWRVHFLAEYIANSETSSAMRRPNLTDLAVFMTLAECLSFRVAAQQLGVTPSALSHRIRQLEEHLGVRLLHRTTRNVSPTDAGRRLLARIRPAVEQIDGAVADLTSSGTHPSGRLALYLPKIGAELVVAPIWRKFLAAYPDVQLELGVGNDTAANIVAKGYDAGIGIREFLAQDLTAVRVTNPLNVAVVASPAYFAQRSKPHTPEDLLEHNCILSRLPDGGPLIEWSFNQKKSPRTLRGKMQSVPVKGNLVIDDHEVCTRAAVDGIGVTYTLVEHVEKHLKSGALVRVLENWSPTFEGFFLYYPGHRQIPTALRAMIDMIRVSYRSQAHPPANPFVQTPERTAD